MKQKQVRDILSDADYPLSPQEQKEHSSPTLMPYCKARALGKLLGLPLCQPKESLIRAVDRKLFFDPGFVKPETKDLQKHYEAEMFGNLKLSEDRCEGESDMVSGTEEPKPLSAVFNNSELLNLQKTKLGPDELYKCLGNFTRPNMIFYNYLRNVPSSPTPIIYLPYTPANIQALSDSFIKSLAKHLGFFTQYEEGSKYNILRQKLRDLFYLVEDHEDLHLVVPCQSHLKNCQEVASEYCANYMCKICCQESGHKLPCLIHSDENAVFRYKTTLLLSAEKEWGLDAEKTLRVKIRGKMRLKDLQGRLSKYDIEWNNLKVLENPLVHKIQYAYVEFKNREEAEKAFLEHKEILKKTEGSIEALYESPEKFLERTASDNFLPENILIIYKPSTSLKISNNIPCKSERCVQVHSLLSILTGLEKDQIKVLPSFNKVTGGFNPDQIFVVFPSKVYVQKAYVSQPFFKHLIADKLIHMDYYCELKPHQTMCARCSLNLNPECTLGLCDECCARQAYLKNYCTHSNKLREALGSIKGSSVCEICANPLNDESKLCTLCKLYQPVRPLFYVQPASLYQKVICQMSIIEFIFYYKKKLVELEMILRTLMINGIYTWFSPIESTAIYKKMADANKELHQKHISIEDNKKASKFRVSGPTLVESGIDPKGEQYVDYIYDSTEETKLLQIGVLGKQKKGSQYTFTEKQWGLKSKAAHHVLTENFHLFLLGLDVCGFTRAQLRTAVYEELNRKVGKIVTENIQFIDPHSLVNKIYIESNSWEKADEVMRKYGIVCIVKFNDILDAIRLISADVALRLPLCLEAERVHIVPSKMLVKYIEDYN